MGRKKLMKKTHMVTCTAFTLLLLFACISGFSQAASTDLKPMKVQCSAQGTSTQSGSLGTITIQIDEYSSQQERETLVQAFKESGTEGMTAVLKKLPQKGFISIAGQKDTYQLKFVRVLPGSTASIRKIRLVTDRPTTIGESMAHTRSLDYSVLAVEFTLDMSKMGKSTGTLLPAIELVADKKTNEITIKSYQFPWKLFNFFNFKEGK
jgi:hypothetical protein